MVFFTCSNCGDSVKKPTVSKHLQTKCRVKNLTLTCVDCLKDFRGTEYEAHTKCVSESERYSAKGQPPKPSQNKGEKKQQTWHECMQMVLKKPTLKPDERDLIRSISKYDNVPRKKPKFINFVTHAFRQYVNRNELIERVWKEIEEVFKEVSVNASEADKQLKQPKSPKPEVMLEESDSNEQEQPKPESKQQKQSKSDSKHQKETKSDPLKPAKQDSNKPSKQDSKQEAKQQKQESKPSKQQQPKQETKQSKGESKQAKQPKGDAKQQQQQKQQKNESKSQKHQKDSKNAKPAEEGEDKKENKRKRAAEDEKAADINVTAAKGEGQKKKKQKSTDEKKVEKAEGNDVDMLMYDESDTSTDKINRKRKKADDNCQTETNDFFADQGEPGKKKKKKHDKTNDNQSSESQNTKEEDGGSKSEKTKKSKKSASANPSSEAKDATEKTRSGGGDAANAGKKSKKSKKSENKENIAEKEEEGEQDLEEQPAAKQAVKTKSCEEGESEKAAPKPKKVKTEAGTPPPKTNNSEKGEQFDWKATILQVLNKDGKDNRIQLQKLQKKVLQLHCQMLNCENSDKKKNKFMKKLKEMQEITMDKDFVVLKS